LSGTHFIKRLQREDKKTFNAPPLNSTAAVKTTTQKAQTEVKKVEPSAAVKTEITKLTAETNEQKQKIEAIKASTEKIK